MYATKQRAAVNALTEIARRLAAAPLGPTYDECASADEMLNSLMVCEPFIEVRTRYSGDGPDSGEHYTYCTVCHEEAHNADCPVRTLEELWGTLDSPIQPGESVRLAW